MSIQNGVDGLHETSERAAPRLSQRFPKDITKSVMPTMTALMMAFGIAGAGYGLGVYKTRTDSHLEAIDSKLKVMNSDLYEIKKLLQRRTARS